MAYENGGGAFIIPYIIALLLIGIPILFLDYAIGHKYRGTPPLALRRLARGGEWLGWFQVGVSIVIFTYYAVVIAWAANYVVFSVKESWNKAPDTETFFIVDFLKLPEDTMFSLMPVAAVTIPLILIWIGALFIMGRGVQRGIAAANKVFLPLLVVLFVIMVVRALFLPGAVDGLNMFFAPNWGALADLKVWTAAVAQIFFSLSVAFGIMMTYASYLGKKANLTGAGLVAGFANSSFEVLAGIGVFSALGFMAFGQGVPLDELALKGVGLSFMTFPMIISSMPGGPLFGVLFFSSLVLAGFTSLVSLLQVASGAFQDKFGWSVPKATLIMGIPAMIVSVALFGSETGLLSLDVVDNFINEIGIVASAVMLTVFVAVRKKLPELRAHLNATSTVKVPKAWEAVVGVVAPIALGFMLVSAIIERANEDLGAYMLGVGWGTIVITVIFAVLMTLTKWRANISEAAPDEVSEYSGAEGGAR